MKNYYEVLKVRPDATAKEIKEAFQKLLIQCMPANHFIDFDHDENYPKTIEEGYKILSDTKKRKEYDKALFEESQGSVIEQTNLENALQNILANPRKPLTYHHSKPTNRLMTVLISLVIVVGISGILLFYFETNDDPKLNFKVVNKGFQDTPAQAGKSTRGPEATPVLESNITNKTKPGSGNTGAPSIQHYLELISDKSLPFEKKQKAVTSAIDLFESNNTHIVILGLNETPIRRQTASDYMDFLMLQDAEVVIKKTEKNNQGKITQMTVHENFDYGFQ